MVSWVLAVNRYLIRTKYKQLMNKKSFLVELLKVNGKFVIL